MAANYPDVIPMIAYEDGPKAMDWLSSAFGFTERARMLDNGGRLSHGEMQAGGGGVMLGPPPPPHPAPPAQPRGVGAAPRGGAGSPLVSGPPGFVAGVSCPLPR